MAFPVKIENNLVIVECQNIPVTHAEIVETIKMFIDNPLVYSRKKLLIIDPGSNYHPIREELNEFANLIRSSMDTIFYRIALVVSRDLHFGLGRMTEVFSQSEHGEFRVFNNEEDARKWLNL